MNHMCFQSAYDSTLQFKKKINKLALNIDVKPFPDTLSVNKFLKIMHYE